MRRILVVATGGTIASVAEGDGLAPGLTGTDLVRAVPLVAAWLPSGELRNGRASRAV